MPEVKSVIEYPQDGIAIIEDGKGKFVASRDSSDIIPLYDYNVLNAYFGRREPCALLRSRESMLT